VVIERLVELRQSGKTWKEIGQIFHRHPEACRAAYRKFKARVEGKVETEQERLLSSAYRAQELRELRALAREQNLWEALQHFLRETIPAFPPVPPPLEPPNLSGVSRETALLVLSDWHAYEIVSRERTRGLNVYDADIFGRRVRQIITNTLKIKQKLEASSWQFPAVVVALNGDFVSGTIHDLERFLDAPNIVQAVYGTAYVLAQALRDLAQAYPRVTCYGVAGNHGRLPDQRVMNPKDPWRNWDTLIYLLAREMLRETPHVTFVLPEAYAVLYDVEGTTVLQSHGHEIKQWMHLPYYGINRAVTTVNALEALRGNTVNVHLFGHFHVPTTLEVVGTEVFINGSLIGLTEYSLQFGGMNEPGQLLLHVHREHGVTSRWWLRADIEPAGPGYVTTPWKSLGENAIANSQVQGAAGGEGEE
jgi:predicted phosphodiesterase